MSRVFKLVIVGVVLLVLLFLAASVLPRLLLLFSRQSTGESPPPLPVNVSYPVLGSLSYRFTGAREHASWIWGNLSEYPVGDPAVSPYIEWLRSVLEPWFRKHPFRHGDYVLVDSPVATSTIRNVYHSSYGGWIVEERVEPVKEAVLPAENTSVRIGYIKLPFGYGLVLTAYQDRDGYINIVVHGTVLNETEFLELVIRSAAYPLHEGGVDLYYMQYCMEPASEYCLTYPLLHPRTPIKPRTYWFLWRIALPGYGHLEVNETLRIPVRHVYILLEMPLLGEEPVTWVFDPLLLGPETQGIYNATVIRVLRTLEYTYLALSHTAFGLASNFARIDDDPLTVVKTIALYNVVYDSRSGGFKSPLEARLRGGAVCHGFSTSTGITASILGYPAIDVSVLHPLAEHAVSGFLRLSSTGERGSVRMPVDLDLDGVPDTYDVIADTAYMPRESLEEKFLSIGYFYPPLMPHGYWSKGEPPRLPNGLIGLEPGQEVRVLLNGLIGVPQAVIGLPEWLKTLLC